MSSDRVSRVCILFQTRRRPGPLPIQMQIGLKFTGPGSLARADAIELFARADRLGYHSLWAGERFAPDLLLTLAEMAFRTERILLGSAVVNVFSRTPAAIATAAVTLDRMSEGRLLLGLGVSGRVVVEDWHGLPFHRPYQRLREYVEIIRQIVGGWRVQHEGEVLRLGGHVIEVTPLRDRIPIYVGALGPKAVRLTGEIADGWIPVMNAPDEMEGDFEALRAGAAAAGRVAEDVVVAPDVLALVTDDKPEARNMMRATMARPTPRRGCRGGHRRDGRRLLPLRRPRGDPRRDRAARRRRLGRHPHPAPGPGESGADGADDRGAGPELDPAQRLDLPFDVAEVGKRERDLPFLVDQQAGTPALGVVRHVLLDGGLGDAEGCPDGAVGVDENAEGELLALDPRRGVLGAPVVHPENLDALFLPSRPVVTVPVTVGGSVPASGRGIEPEPDLLAAKVGEAHLGAGVVGGGEVGGGVADVQHGDGPLSCVVSNARPIIKHPAGRG